MMLTAHKLSLSIGSTALLDAVDFGIEAGERVCLVGRNGSGKSTLLRVLAGDVAPDSGELRHAAGLRIASLPQDSSLPPERSVFDVVADGLGEVGAQLAEYHRLVREAPDNLAALAQVQQKVEAGGGWSLDSRVEAVLSRLDLDGDARCGTLSGGQRRRVWLARALVGEPELLLLDEPTNHLDIDAIRWLEDFLRDWSGTVLFVTHDRAFLRRVATRILELDRGAISSWPGDYDNYLRRKDEQLHAEALERARVDRKLAQEEVWIRQGIKARRTRNEGRVRALQQLRAEVAARRERQGEVRLLVAEAERSGRLVSEATALGFSWGDQPVVHGLSTTILRGDRVGLIGPNGAGKTTLLRLLLGQLEPDSGSVRLGTKLQVAYFDQMRAALDPERSVADSINDGRDFVELGDSRRHVMTYLQDFLFTPDRARSPVRSLSGGEASRLLLARLFAQPSNLLVLDEPTNDLDIETLELLEERLSEYQGTVLLVSHDRDFLDRVVTRSLVFEGQGRVLDLVGGYSEWQAWRDRSGRDAVPARAPAERKAPPTKPGVPAPKRDARAIRRVTRRIEQLEAEQETLSTELADGAIYRDDPARAGSLQKRLSALQAELESAYAEWQRLEG